MSVFSKILESTSKNIAKAIHKEQRGIYNVTYNGKFSTPIKKDLDTLDEALRYARGNKNKGAKHIKIKHHTDPKQEGYITQQELLNMGKNIREYLAKHKEPFIDKNGARLYEWENEAGERFRLVVNDVLPKVSKNIASGSGKSPQLLQPPADDIITFFSSRNLPQGKVFEFKNPKLQDKKHSGDKSLTLSKTSSSKAAEQEALNLDSHHNSTKNTAQNQAELPFMRE